MVLLKIKVQCSNLVAAASCRDNIVAGSHSHQVDDSLYFGRLKAKDFVHTFPGNSDEAQFIIKRGGETLGKLYRRILADVKTPGQLLPSTTGGGRTGAAAGAMAWEPGAPVMEYATRMVTRRLEKSNGLEGFFSRRSA